jgi:hypothetical protein
LLIGPRTRLDHCRALGALAASTLFVAAVVCQILRVMYHSGGSCHTKHGAGLGSRLIEAQGAARQSSDAVAAVVIELACEQRREPRAARADFLVERRGFKLMVIVA